MVVRRPSYKVADMAALDQSPPQARFFLSYFLSFLSLSFSFVGVYTSLGDVKNSTNYMIKYSRTLILLFLKTEDCKTWRTDQPVRFNIPITNTAETNFEVHKTSFVHELLKSLGSDYNSIYKYIQI
jgi:hypothetical protein